MKVSVLMALYNGEKYLAEQLESIYFQTRRADEVLICDDGSVDGSVRLAEEFIRAHGLQDSWRVQVNEKNLGYAENFFRNMEGVSGDVIFFSDQDDVWYGNKIEKCCEILEENAEAVLLCSEFEPYICSEDAPEIPGQFLRYLKNDGSIERLRLNNRTIFIGSEGCTMCVRRQFINKIRPYHLDGWAHDDYVWKMAMAQDGCYYYHKPLIKRRMHSANVSKKKIRGRAGRIVSLERLQAGLEKMLEYGKQVGMNPGSQRLTEKNIRAASLRAGLLRDRKYSNFLILLLFHFHHYQSVKSIPVELYLAVKGRG